MILGTFAHVLFILLPSSSIRKYFLSEWFSSLQCLWKKREMCWKYALCFRIEVKFNERKSLLLFSRRSRGHSLNVCLMVALEHKLVVKVEPATSKICIHYKLGVGLAYVQEEAYDGLEVLTTPLGSGGRLAQGVAQGTPTPRPDPSQPLSSNAPLLIFYPRQKTFSPQTCSFWLRCTVSIPLGARLHPCAIYLYPTRTFVDGLRVLIHKKGKRYCVTFICSKH